MDVAKLRQLIEPHGVDSRASRAFDLTMMAFIIIALITFSLETLPDNPPWLTETLYIVEVITVTVFTVEYLLRLYVAEKKLAFLFSFYGLVDLAAILPFYLAVGVDLRSLRVLRLFRIFRALKLLRYSRAIRHFRDALYEVREELILYLMATAFLMYLASAGIYYFERDAQPENFQSIFHSMWWAVVTLTTVGYGDVYPATVGGKIFTGFLLMIGLGIIAVPSGLLASGLTQARQKERALRSPKDDADGDTHGGLSDSSPQDLD